MISEDFSNLSNSELCKFVSQGSASAEQQVYQNNIGMAQKEAFRWLNNREDAADIAQDALLTVLCKLRDGFLEEPEKLEGFIRRTVKFSAIGFLRKHSVSKTVNVASIAENSISSEFDGFVYTAKKEIDNKVVVLLESLQQGRDRNLLKQHYLNQVPKTTLCSQFDLEPAQFDRVIHRARSRLRKSIELLAPDLFQEVCN